MYNICYASTQWLSDMLFSNNPNKNDPKKPEYITFTKLFHGSTQHLTSAIAKKNKLIFWKEETHKINENNSVLLNSSNVDFSISINDTISYFNNWEYIFTYRKPGNKRRMSLGHTMYML